MIVVAVNDKSQVRFANSIVSITPQMSLAPATPYAITMDPYALRSVGARLPVQVSAADMQFVTSFLEDCLVSPWSSWSPCGTTCTKGQQSRYRVVTRASKAGCSKSLEDNRDCPLPAACANLKPAEVGSSDSVQFGSLGSVAGVPQVVQFGSLGPPTAVAVDEAPAAHVTVDEARAAQATLGITPEIVSSDAVPAQVENQVPSLPVKSQMQTPVAGGPSIPPGMIPPGMRIVATAPSVVNLNLDPKLMQMPEPLPGGM